MKNIWLLSLERVPTRYTWEWGTFIPEEIRRQAESRGLTVAGFTYEEYVAARNQYTLEDEPEVCVVDVTGELPTQTASTGGFLNWATTNIWKSSQLKKVAELFNNGHVKNGDIFYVTDAWNPGILQIKYMSELMDIDVKIMAQWHAGAHDPWDFLGRKIKDKTWVFELERALFHAIDYNLFTTNAYIEMFGCNLGLNMETPRVVRTGYPNGYLLESLPKYKIGTRDNNILFPHRIAPEKQLDIFLDLAKELPQYNWIVCQDRQLSKEEYHTLLGNSKLVFSAALQETFGIAQTEAILAGAISLSPDRLSYSEMYYGDFLYPSEWTWDMGSYLKHKEYMMGVIVHLMESFETPLMQELIAHQEQNLLDNDYIGGKKIWQLLLD